MKSFRDFISEIDREGMLRKVKRPVSPGLELASVLSYSGKSPVLFESVAGSQWRAVGNVFPTRELVARYLGTDKKGILPALAGAIKSPSLPGEVPAESAPVMENTVSEPDLSLFPIPIHTEKDGGPYIASAIVVANDPEHGRNSSFHRMMVIGRDRLAVRILPRHLNEYITRAGGTLDVAVVIGSPINVLLASAISVGLGDDEFGIANALMPFSTVKLGNGVSVPADAEIAFEATITEEMHDEGPFVDLTETYDILRKQRVMRVNRIHHRNNPIFHALLPGGLEHKILMGMPREPTIFNEVDKVCECKEVNITPGGCSWLHGVVSISKKSEDDARKAIDAAFRGHKSMKHVVVVDDDIDVFSPQEVEWAIATRVQADRDVHIFPGQKGSSLDPSADPSTCITAKVGIDATMPLGRRSEFARAKYLDIRIGDYI